MSESNRTDEPPAGGATNVNEERDLAQSPELTEDRNVNDLRIRMVGDLVGLTGIITSVERRLRDKRNTRDDLEQMVESVNTKRDDVFTSVTGWERGTQRNLDQETDSLHSRAVDSSNKLLKRLNDEINSKEAPRAGLGMDDYSNREYGIGGGSTDRCIGDFGQYDKTAPEASGTEPAGLDSEYDALIIRTKLLTEAAAIKVERRYSNEYFEQKERDNAERAARLERRIIKKAEAERLRAETERLRVEEEIFQEEEARIREEEDRRKAEIDIEMREESVKARIRVLEEVEAARPHARPPWGNLTGSDFPTRARLQYDLPPAASTHPPPEMKGRPNLGAVSASHYPRGGGPEADSVCRPETQIL